MEVKTEYSKHVLQHPSLFESLTNYFARRINERYSIEVIFKQLDSGAKASFDGVRIEIDPSVDSQYKLYLVLHLFGHIAVWHTDSSTIEFSKAIPNPTIDIPSLIFFLKMEETASSYGTKLLEENRLPDLIPWFSDIAQKDLSYFLHFAATGEQLSLEHFKPWSKSFAQPRDIPSFAPQFVLRIETS